jgi:PAS domain S-box-containing protein
MPLSDDLHWRLFDASPNPTLVLDRRLHIVTANRAWLASARRELADIVGRRVWDAFPTDPETERQAVASFERAIRTKQADTVATITHTPVLGADGEVELVLQHPGDVAERDQSQYIFDTMTEGFALIDRDWTILRMNAAGLQLARRPAHEVVGRKQWEAFPEDAGSDIERLYRTVMEQGKAGTVETRHPLPSGGTRWLEVRVIPALHGGLAVFFRDISDRKHAEEQLRLEAHRKDEFLAMLAHELRNPLAPIGAAADLLVMGGLDPARVRRTSAIITRQVGHMSSLIDDLLDVSRVTRGLVALERAPVDLKAAVADAVEQVRPLIEARRHRLEVHMAPDHTMVEGDRKRLVQVLANLINNAAKYTPEGGRIVVDMDVEASDPGRVTLCVTDNGIGMTPAVRAGAFELFTQAQRTPDRAQGGLGIGLALVKSLVELHGGSVEAWSDGPGQGSHFTVSLPRMAERHAEAPEPPWAHAALEPRPAAARRRVVLVVDDNVDAAQLLAMVLENLGYEALVEHDPQRALAVAAERRPDICILDIGLPDMDGNELARRLRRQAGTEHALLIAVTGYGRPQDREQALAAGFDHHLVKPVDVHRLAQLLG